MTKRVKQKIGMSISLTSVALALFFFALDAAGQSTSEDKFAHFQLFADCQPMDLVVENLNSYASEIDLTKESIQTAAESRLRSARLYVSSLASPYLYINVNVVDRAFSINLGYKKPVYDPLSDSNYPATTWVTGSTGTHGGNASYILSSVSRYMDEFLVEFLRVNEEAC